MMQVKTAVQWVPPADKTDGKPRSHSPASGVVYIPARRVNDAARGIAYDQPGGWYAQTFYGNVQVAPGDWIITCASGNVYVIREVDYYHWFDAGLRAPWQVKVLRFLRKCGLK